MRGPSKGGGGGGRRVLDDPVDVEIARDRKPLLSKEFKVSIPSVSLLSRFVSEITIPRYFPPAPADGAV